MAPSVDATGAPLPASWLEFAEHNRHVEHNQSVFRPNDRDWTGRYAFMRGPLWVPQDSGIPYGGPPFPDHIHQVNWGRAGMRELNAPRSKEVRRLHTADSQRRPASSAP